MNHNNSDQVDFGQFVSQMFRLKWLWILCCTLAAVLSIWFSLQLPNVYKSEATLLPANETTGKAGGLSSSLGSLGAIAGLNLGGGGEKKSQVAMQLMKSREFFADFNKQHHLTVALMAANGWNPATGELSYDPEIYDIATKSWVREARELRGSEPGNNEIYQEFMKRLVIFREKQTGVINVSLEFVSPDLAQKWLQLFITEVNEAMRRNDMKEANTTIAYLDKKLQETQVTEVRELLFSLLEENTKTLTMATVRPDYVFKVIDPPYRPDLKVGPMRSLIVLGSVFGSFMLFCIVVLSAMVLRRAQQSTSK